MRAKTRRYIQFLVNALGTDPVEDVIPLQPLERDADDLFFEARRCQVAAHFGVLRDRQAEDDVVSRRLGLDPRGQQELLELIERIARERNVGVILCSHDLPEVESVCDDVLIMNLGQVVASGTVSEVIGRTRRNVAQGNGLRVNIPLPSIVDARRVLEAAPNVLRVTHRSEDAGPQPLSPVQEQQAPLREGHREKTDLSKLKANKEEIDAAGQDYGANEKDKFEPGGGAAVAEKQAPVKVGPKIGRNDPCPCGSGKKYKHCHGKES
jgi:hypothetical protein